MVNIPNVLHILGLLELFRDPRVLNATGPMIDVFRKIGEDTPALKPATDFMIASLESGATMAQIGGNLAIAGAELVSLVATQRGPAEFHRGAHGG